MGELISRAFRGRRRERGAQYVVDGFPVLSARRRIRAWTAGGSRSPVRGSD